VVCSIQLQIPHGGSLLTCPNCKTLMNPSDRDLRFMNCGSCRSLLQFSLTLIRQQNVPQPILRCGRCQVSNYIPQSILNPIHQHHQYQPQQQQQQLPVASILSTPPTPRPIQQQQSLQQPIQQQQQQQLQTPQRRLSGSQRQQQNPSVVPSVASPPKLISIIDEKDENKAEEKKKMLVYYKVYQHIDIKVQLKYRNEIVILQNVVFVYVILKKVIWLKLYLAFTCFMKKN